MYKKCAYVQYTNLLPDNILEHVNVVAIFKITYSSNVILKGVYKEIL